MSRVRKFLETFVRSENSYVSFIGKRAEAYTTGTLGINRAKLANENVIEEHDANLLSVAGAIRELIEIKGGSKYVDGISNDDAATILESLCCD